MWQNDISNDNKNAKMFMWNKLKNGGGGPKQNDFIYEGNTGKEGATLYSNIYDNFLYGH